ncbi:MAG: TlpA disulfide reductase family protein [Bacteroidales bacterium]
MKKSISILLFASTLLFGCRGDKSAKISGTVEGAAAGTLTLQMLDINRLKIVDTLKYDSNGSFHYKVKGVGESPNFYYLFYNREKIASLIILPGDNISITTDTLSHFVELKGSPESTLLSEIEQELQSSGKIFDSLMREMEHYKERGLKNEAERINYLLGAQFVKTKREAIRRAVKNPHSITNLTLFYHKFSPQLPLFGDLNDAAIFRNIYDSMAVRYPNSHYLVQLNREILDREKVREFNAKLQEAQEIGFPEITLPDINSNMVSLSSFKGKVVLLSIWSAADTPQRLLNQEYLELYNKFAGTGQFEIFQVSLDIDKSMWATAVKEQKLPWISLCDIRGGRSKVISSYNIEKLPANFIIDKNGDIVAKDLFGSELEKIVAKLAKN